MTEGSRGAVKDASQQSHPVVQVMSEIDYSGRFSTLSGDSQHGNTCFVPSFGFGGRNL